MRHKPYCALTILTCINLLNYIDRYVVAAVFDPIKHDLHLSDAELGLLYSSFIILYSLASPVFGRVGDLFIRKKIIALGSGIWSLATAGAGIAQNYTQLFLTRAIVGIGEASYGTISPSLIADLFKPSERGRMFSVFYAATPIGSALGYLMGGVLASHYGWRKAFYIVGLPGILFALLALIIREPRRGATEDPTGPQGRETGSTIEAIRLLFKNRLFILATLGFSAYTFALGGLAAWMPTYLMRIDHMPLESANRYFGGITVATGFLGTMVGGFLGDYFLGFTKKSYLLVSAGSLLMGAPISCLALLSRSSQVYLPAIFCAEIFLFLSTGPLNTIIVNSVPANLRSTAMAVNIFFIHMLGDSVSPYIIGQLSDFWGLVIAAQIAPLIMTLGAIILFYACKHQKG